MLSALIKTFHLPGRDQSETLSFAVLHHGQGLVLLLPCDYGAVGTAEQQECPSGQRSKVKDISPASILLFSILATSFLPTPL